MIERRFPEAKPDRYDALVAELVLVEGGTRGASDRNH
jgi:hypothetical protein